MDMEKSRLAHRVCKFLILLSLTGIMLWRFNSTWSLACDRILKLWCLIFCIFQGLWHVCSLLLTIACIRRSSGHLDVLTISAIPCFAIGKSFLFCLQIIWICFGVCPIFVDASCRRETQIWGYAFWWFGFGTKFIPLVFLLICIPFLFFGSNEISNDTIVIDCVPEYLLPLLEVVDFEEAKCRVLKAGSTLEQLGVKRDVAVLKMINENLQTHKSETCDVEIKDNTRAHAQGTKSVSEMFQRRVDTIPTSQSQVLIPVSFEVPMCMTSDTNANTDACWNSKNVLTRMQRCSAASSVIVCRQGEKYPDVCTSNYLVERCQKSPDSPHITPNFSEAQEVKDDISSVEISIPEFDATRNLDDNSAQECYKAIQPTVDDLYDNSAEECYKAIQPTVDDLYDNSAEEIYTAIQPTVDVNTSQVEPAADDSFVYNFHVHVPNVLLPEIFQGAGATRSSVLLLVSHLLPALPCNTGRSFAIRRAYSHDPILATERSIAQDPKHSGIVSSKRDMSYTKRVTWAALKLMTVGFMPPPTDYDCLVCFDKFRSNDPVLLLPCDARHFFHPECIKTWLRKSKFCPTCRSDVAALIEERNDIKRDADEIAAEETVCDLE